MGQLNFDASGYSPNFGVDVVPPGWYPVMITNSEDKATSKGDGAYLQLTMTILDGQYKGQVLFTRLNLQNPNPTAVEIAYKELGAICHAIGRLQITHSSQLHDVPFKVRVATRKDKSGEYDDQNEIKSYKHISFVTDAPSAGPAARPAAAPPAPTGAPPTGWAPPPAAAAPPPAAPPPAAAPPTGYPPQGYAAPPAAAPVAPPAPTPPTWGVPPQTAAPAQPPPAQPPAAAPGAPAQPWQGGPPPGAPTAAVPPWQQPR